MRNDPYQSAGNHHDRGDDQLQSQRQLDARLGGDGVDVGRHKGGGKRDQDA